MNPVALPRLLERASYKFASDGTDRRPQETLQMKIFSRWREPATRAYYGAVFEIKKKIPN
jgi:hypothetical protein